MCQMTETANLDLFRLLYIGSSAAMIPKLNNYWREGAYCTTLADSFRKQHASK
jgi:hypothetical protein